MHVQNTAQCAAQSRCPINGITNATTSFITTIPLILSPPPPLLARHCAGCRGYRGKENSHPLSASNLQFSQHCPVELPAMIEMFQMCILQCGGQKPHVAFKH